MDCFANHYNFKISWFFSRFWTPGCAWIDFFVQSLSNENFLVVPLVRLVSNILHYMFEPSSSFWPLISRIYANYIVHRVESFLLTIRWNMVETRMPCWTINVLKARQWLLVSFFLVLKHHGTRVCRSCGCFWSVLFPPAYFYGNGQRGEHAMALACGCYTLLGQWHWPGRVAS